MEPILFIPVFLILWHLFILIFAETVVKLGRRWRIRNLEKMTVREVRWICAGAILLGVVMFFLWSEEIAKTTPHRSHSVPASPGIPVEP